MRISYLPDQVLEYHHRQSPSTCQAFRLQESGPERRVMRLPYLVLMSATLFGTSCLVYGLLMEFAGHAAQLPAPFRRLHSKIRLSALCMGMGVAGILCLVCGSCAPGWCGLVIAPCLYPLCRNFWCRWDTHQLEQSSLPFFQALLGLLRAGVAVPAALLRALAASPGFFSHTLQERLRLREKGETLPQALSRLHYGLPPGQAAECLQTLGHLYERGVGLVWLLERQTVWMANDLRRRAKLRSLQASLFVQGVLCAVLPWGVLVFSFSGSEQTEWARLWAAPSWRIGLGCVLFWQLLGGLCLARLGRLF